MRASTRTLTSQARRPPIHRFAAVVRPGTRALHVHLLSALNTAGAGGHVLRTAVASCLEIFLTTKRAQAQGFEMAMPATLQASFRVASGACVAAVCKSARQGQRV